MMEAVRTSETSVDNHFTRQYMEAVRTSETSVDNHFTRQYNPEDSSEHHTRRRENLKSHMEVRSWNSADFSHFIMYELRMALAACSNSYCFLVTNPRPFDK
jgi:hypothetical protein